MVRRRRGFLGECYRGPRHLGGKALVDAAQNASAGVFHTVSSSLLMSVMACVSWSLKHRWHLLPSGMVQNGVCGEEPYRQPHRVCQWMFSVENCGAPEMCTTLVEVFLIQHLPEMASRYFFTMRWTAFCVGMWPQSRRGRPGSSPRGWWRHHSIRGKERIPRCPRCLVAS